MVLNPILSKVQKRLKVLSTAVVLCFSMSTALADERSDEAIKAAFQTQHGEQFDTSKLVGYLSQLFSAIDIDRDGLEEEEIVLYKKIQQAGLRARFASQILRYDLDGDAIVTRAEIETFLKAQQRGRRIQPNPRLDARIKTGADKLLKDDPNNDGRIEPSEYTALSQLTGSRNQRRLHDVAATALLEADPNKDGMLTQAEAMVLIGSAFRGVDIMPRIRGGFRLKSSCKAPKAAKNVKVFLIGANEGSGLPTVTVAGQDRVTTTNSITIEKGKSPIYLVMTSSNPLIWRIEGATDRISHVLVAARTKRGQKVPAGVTGVARDKVSFTTTNCIPNFVSGRGKNIKNAKAAVGMLTGQEVTGVANQYTLHNVYVPSGIHSTVNHKRGGGLLRRYHPSGILEIDAKSVISDVEAVDYGVLPQDAGLSQLVTRGALKRVAREKFRILKKMRFPAGLNGPHKVTFLLPKGVPEPSGHPGHSCVAEDMGQNVAGRCRGKF